MPHCTALCCGALRYAVICYPVLCSFVICSHCFAVQFYVVLVCTLLYCAVVYYAGCTVLWRDVQCSALMRCVVMCRAVSHWSAVPRHNTVIHQNRRYCTVWQWLRQVPYISTPKYYVHPTVTSLYCYEMWCTGMSSGLFFRTRPYRAMPCFVATCHGTLRRYIFVLLDCTSDCTSLYNYFMPDVLNTSMFTNLQRLSSDQSYAVLLFHNVW